MSKVVPAPQVWSVAVPDCVGTHCNTCSGELLVIPHVPACVLAPAVVPVKVPPCAGMRVGLVQALGVAVAVGVGVSVGVGVAVGV